MSRISSFATSTLLALGLIASWIASTPAAQAQNALLASVPFAFSVGDRVRPAGTYRVDWASQPYLSMRDVKTGSSHRIVVLPASSQKLSAQSRLTFHCYESRCYLSSAWFAGTASGIQVSRSRSERESLLASKAAPAPEVQVAMGTSR